MAVAPGGDDGAMRRTLSLVLIVLVLVLAFALVAGAVLNSERLDTVTVRFQGPGEEVRDARLPGADPEDALPDYRLDIVHTEGRFRAGTWPNQSAAEGLVFTVAEDIPLRQVQELVLVEDDRLKDDPLVRVQHTDQTMSAKGYTFTTSASRSMAVGLGWFFATAVGKAILAGITLAVVILIVSHVGLP